VQNGKHLATTYIAEKSEAIAAAADAIYF